MSNPIALRVWERKFNPKCYDVLLIDDKDTAYLKVSDLIKLVGQDGEIGLDANSLFSLVVRMDDWNSYKKEPKPRTTNG